MKLILENFSNILPIGHTRRHLDDTFIQEVLTILSTADIASKGYNTLFTVLVVCFGLKRSASR
jgi:hypothetical protein